MTSGGLSSEDGECDLAFYNSDPKVQPQRERMTTKAFSWGADARGFEVPRGGLSTHHDFGCVLHASKEAKLEPQKEGRQAMEQRLKKEHFNGCTHDQRCSKCGHEFCADCS